ncbi:MAG: DNA-3-methyladenine glycosylase [Verrucomicrobia bacterium]|nr:DNA-3-methyladenine glycosylase [Verrucomicrobiota bacterium]
MFEPLPRSFYRASARDVAPKLLGHWLVRNTPKGQCGGVIVETEAYLADDPACHAFRGKTRRNQSMWGPPGVAYVYLIYGYHHCVNTVCCPEGIAEAVLIRALEPMIGETLMRENRPVLDLRELTNGPAKLCAALDIDRTLDGAFLCDSNSPLFIGRNRESTKPIVSNPSIITTKRVGISKAVDLPLRFYLNGNRHVSKGN